MRRKRSERDPRRSVVARRGVTRSRKKIGCMMNARTDASTDRSSRRPARVTRHCTYASLCWHRSPRRRPVPRAIHLAAAAAERGGRLEKRAFSEKNLVRVSGAGVTRWQDECSRTVEIAPRAQRAGTASSYRRARSDRASGSLRASRRTSAVDRRRRSARARVFGSSREQRARSL